MPDIRQLLELVLTADTSGANEVVKSLSNIGTVANTTEGSLGSAMASGVNGAKATSAEFQNLAAAMRAAGASSSEVSQTLKASGVAGSELAGILKDVGFEDIASSSAKATSSLSGLRNEIRAGTQVMSGFGVESFATGRGIAGLDALALSGTASIAALGVAAVAATAFIVEQGAQLDNAQAKLQAWGNISAAQASAVGQAFLAQGSSITKTAAEEVGALATISPILEQTSTGALNTSQALEVMAAATDLAEATDTKLEQSAVAVATSLRTFSAEGMTAAQVAGLLAAGTELGGVSVDALTTMLGRLHDRMGPLAPDMQGLDVLIAQFEQAGAGGQRGLMAISTGADHLMGSSKATKAELDQLGISLTNADGSSRIWNQIFPQIVSGLSGMSDASRIAAEQALFGTTNWAAWDAVIKQGIPGIDAGRAAVEQHTDVQKQASTQTSTLTGELSKGLTGIKNWAAGVNEALGSSRDYSSGTSDITTKVGELTVTVSRAAIEQVGYNTALANAVAQTRLSQSGADDLIKSGGRLADTMHDESGSVGGAAAATAAFNQAIKDASLSSDMFHTNVTKVIDSLIAGIPAIVTAGLAVNDLNDALARGVSNNSLVKGALASIGEAVKTVDAAAQKGANTTGVATKAYDDETRAQQADLQGKTALAAAYREEAAAVTSGVQSRIDLAGRNVALAQTQDSLNAKLGREGVTAANQYASALKTITDANSKLAQDTEQLSQVEVDKNRIVTQDAITADGQTVASKRDAAQQQLALVSSLTGQLASLGAGASAEAIRQVNDQLQAAQTGYQEDLSSYRTATAEKNSDTQLFIEQQQAMAQAVRQTSADERSAGQDYLTFSKSLTLDIPAGWHQMLVSQQQDTQSVYGQILILDQQLQGQLGAEDRKNLTDKRTALEGELTDVRAVYQDEDAAAQQLSAGRQAADKAASEQAAANRAADLADTIEKNRQKLASELNAISQSEQAQTGSLQTAATVAGIQSQIYTVQAQNASTEQDRIRLSMQASEQQQIAAIKSAEAEKIAAVDEAEKRRLAVENDALLVYEEQVQRAKAAELQLQANIDTAKSNIDIQMATIQIQLANRVAQAQVAAGGAILSLAQSIAAGQVAGAQAAMQANVSASAASGQAAIDLWADPVIKAATGVIEANQQVIEASQRQIIGWQNVGAAGTKAMEQIQGQIEKTKQDAQDALASITQAADRTLATLQAGTQLAMAEVPGSGGAAGIQMGGSSSADIAKMFGEQVFPGTMSIGAQNTALTNQNALLTDQTAQLTDQVALDKQKLDAAQQYVQDQQAAVSVLQDQTSALQDQLQISNDMLAANGQTGTTDRKLLDLQVQRDQAELAGQTTTEIDKQIQLETTRNKLASDRNMLSNVGLQQEIARSQITQDQAKIVLDNVKVQDEYTQSIKDQIQQLTDASRLLSAQKGENSGQLGLNRLGLGTPAVPAASGPTPMILDSTSSGYLSAMAQSTAVLPSGLAALAAALTLISGHTANFAPTISEVGNQQVSATGEVANTAATGATVGAQNVQATDVVNNSVQQVNATAGQLASAMYLQAAAPAFQTASTTMWTSLNNAMNYLPSRNPSQAQYWQYQGPVAGQVEAQYVNQLIGTGLVTDPAALKNIQLLLKYIQDVPAFVNRSPDPMGYSAAVEPMLYQIENYFIQAWNAQQQQFAALGNGVVGAIANATHQSLPGIYSNLGYLGGASTGSSFSPSMSQQTYTPPAIQTILAVQPITGASFPTFASVHNSYDSGGTIPEQVYGVGSSGSTYQFAAGEQVLTTDQMAQVFEALKIVTQLLNAGQNAGLTAGQMIQWMTAAAGKGVSPSQTGGMIAARANYLSGNWLGSNDRQAFLSGQPMSLDNLTQVWNGSQWLGGSRPDPTIDQMHFNQNSGFWEFPTTQYARGGFLPEDILGFGQSGRSYQLEMGEVLPLPDGFSRDGGSRSLSGIPLDHLSELVTEVIGRIAADHQNQGAQQLATYAGGL